MKSNIHFHFSTKTALAIMLAGAVFYAANVNAADPAKPDQAVAQQLADAQMKAAQLQGTLAQNAPHATVSPAAAAMPEMGVPAASVPQMAGMSGAAPGAMKSGGMGDDKMVAMMGQMMGKMDKMMPMMEKMMGGGMGGKMGGGGMSGGGMSAPAPAAPMSGGGMGMDMDDKDEMAGMMGMSAMGAGMSDSALPGFPGASHIYHIGATGFFLDHPQHISLTTDQQVALNKIKDQALLSKSAADRAMEQAEQELAVLTAADQPDIAKVEAKVREIAKMSGDQRLAFIRSVGEAAKLLTADQRKSLTGFAPPAPAMSPMGHM